MTARDTRFRIDMHHEGTSVTNSIPDGEGAYDVVQAAGWAFLALGFSPVCVWEAMLEVAVEELDALGRVGQRLQAERDPEAGEIEIALSAAEDAPAAKVLSLNALTLEMKRIMDEGLELACAKNRDYSGDENPFANFERFGWKGVVVRLADKVERIAHLARADSASVESESVRDTLIDLQNYAAIGAVMFDREAE